MHLHCLAALLVSARVSGKALEKALEEALEKGCASHRFGLPFSQSSTFPFESGLTNFVLVVLVQVAPESVVLVT